MEKKEAMKILKEFRDKSALFSIRTALDTVIPELKESEDEKIKKAIHIYLDWLDGRNKDYQPKGDYTIRDMIAWLEKQDENADVILAERGGEGKNKFKIGDIISNGKVVYRVDNIVKNDIGQDCYFLVSVEMEKNGIRYLILTDSEGKTSHMGEITWLCEQVDKSFEKQGEKKPNKIGPKFKVGDWVVSNPELCFESPLCIKDIDNNNYRVESVDGCSGVPTTGYLDNYYHLWTIEDAEDGDVLYFDNLLVHGSGTLIYKADKSSHYIITKYCSVNEFGFEPNSYISLNDGYIIPATKEQRDFLFRKMKEAGYEWNYEKKELKRIKQK